MKNLFSISLLFAAVLAASSCGTVRQTCPFSQLDSTRVEVRTQTVTKTDTVSVELPVIIERNVTLHDNREFHCYRIRLCHRLRFHLNPGTVRLGEWTGLPDSAAGRGCQNGGEKQKDREEVFHRLGCRLVFIFQYLVQFGLELPELDIVTGFDS